MKTKSILLVDDEVVIVNSLCRELKSDNPTLVVSGAGSGEEALVQIQGHAFDLVVTDLLMPGVDGFQVLKAAKRKDPFTKVIILTGYADLQSSIDALRLGADDFLQKPCDVEELYYRITNCFAKQDLERKVRVYETIVPVCSWCKKIRGEGHNRQGANTWYSLEEYFHKVKGVCVSHGCCPECFARVQQDLDTLPGQRW